MALKIPSGLLIPLLIGLLAVFAVAFPSYFPSLDGPQQIYGAYILKTWPTLSPWYETGLPIASAGFPAIFLPLALLLPWTWALRIALALTTLLWFGAAIALARSLHPGRTVVAALGGTLILGWAFAMGFYSFLIGTSLAALSLAAALDPEASRKSAVKTQVFLSLAVISHLFGGTLGIAVIALMILFLDLPFRDKLERWIKFLTVPAIFSLGLILWSREAVLPSGENTFLADSDRLASICKMGFGGPIWRAVVPTILAAFAATRCLAAAQKKLGDRREWGLAFFVSAALVIALFAPLHLPGWMHFAPRFLPLALLVGVSLLPVERLSKQHLNYATSAIVAFALAAIAWFGNHFYRLSVEVEPLLAVTRAPIRATGPRLPILAEDPWFVGIGSMDVPFPFADPAYNIPLLAAVEQGGMVPYTFTTIRAIHPFVDKRDHPPIGAIPPREHFWLGLHDPEVRKKPNLRPAVLNDLALHASRFDGVILFGSPEDQKVFDARGFEANWRSDSGYLATFKGCPTTLGLKGFDGAPKKLIAAYGWFPVMRPFWSQSITREEPLTKIDLPSAPCGPIWVEVKNEDGSVVCAGAQPDGRLLATDRTTQKGILCTLQAVAR